MDNRNVWVAIIAGGQGTRLFPISHTDRPKQFCQLDEKNKFIQAVIENFASVGIKRNHMVVITTSDNQTRLAKEQVLPRGVLSQNILQIRPDLGYALAMAEATKFIYELDEDAVVINTPSDQYISPGDEFTSTINNAVSEAKKQSFVIIGVKINDLVTAMGCGHALYTESDDVCQAVEGFVEKPDKAVANKIMRAGNSACNTGINVWQAKAFLDATSSYLKKGMGTDELMNILLPRLKIAVGNFEWRDCGTLKSLYEISRKTPNHKNASLGSGTFERTDCRRSMLYASNGMELRVTGAEDDAVIFTTIHEHPIIVVAKMSESQRIKQLAEDYKAHEAFLTDNFAFGARNNIVLKSNVEDLVVGFVGVENYAVYVHREKDGMMVAAVSQQQQKR